jgi:hypothetical protein
MKQNNETSCNSFRWGREGVNRWWRAMYNISLFGIVTMNPLYDECILIKKILKKMDI